MSLPIPVTVLPRGHESSPMRSPRDSDATARAWQKNNKTSASASATNAALRKLERDIEKLRRRVIGGGLEQDFPIYFPFKVYLSPPNPAGGASTAWRTFRVRSGQLGPALDVPDGTDAVTDPYGTEIPDFEADLIDFVVPDATAAYYVWIDCTNTAALVIDKGTTEPDYDSGDFVLIAVIDTNTDTAKQLAHVRQYVNSDLPVKLSICDATGVSKTLWMPCGKQTKAPTPP